MVISSSATATTLLLQWLEYLRSTAKAVDGLSRQRPISTTCA